MCFLHFTPRETEGFTEDTEGLGEVASAGRDAPALGKEGELGVLRAVGELPGFALQWCLGTQRDGSMGTQGVRTLSTEGPGFNRPAHAPCDVKTENHQMSRDSGCLDSEDANSEHSRLKIRDTSFLQASSKPSPHPRAWYNPMREKKLE